MKKLLLSILSLFCLVSCGGNSTSFQGTWVGSFDRLDNNSCPFVLTADIDPLFPMTISVAADGTFTVLAAEGSVATGGQGDGEQVSFSAYADVFGDYGSILPYVCTSSARVGYLTTGSDDASVTVTYFFSNCTTPDSSTVLNCSSTYYGDATRA